MLDHPFYRDWMAGTLTFGQLRRYAAEYKPFVDAFPRFVSAVHSQCEDMSARRILLENLMEEEGTGHSPPHPELWRDFSEGIGASTVGSTRIGEALRDSYFSLCSSSYAHGLGALHAYESQIPEVARAKIEGLERHYGVTHEKSIRFFSVHETADIYHSRAVADLIERLDPAERGSAREAARKASQALWSFLSGVHAS